MLREYTIPCKYNNLKLKDCVYLVASAHTNDIDLNDDNNHYNLSLNGNVIKMEAKNVTLTEEVSLDGRYAFERTVEFTLVGYANDSTIGQRRYVVVETEDGVRFMVNIDFKAEISYDFTLNDSTYATRFTFHTFSNFPLLEISNSFTATTYNQSCGYMVSDIESVQIAYFRDVRLTSYDYLEVVGDFIKMEYQKASLSESYSDGEYIDSVTLELPLDGRSWHYQLEEFQHNLYFTLIRPKGEDCGYFVGLSLGLQATHTIETDESDSTIRVTLRGRSDIPLEKLFDYSISNEVDTQWIDDKRFQECVSDNTAIYTLKKQVDKFGNPTNLYKAYVGHTEYFESLGFNIIGEFTLGEATEFESQRCSQPPCTISTTLPYEIKLYYNESSMQYQLTCDCDWSVADISSGFTVTPSSGASGQEYNISIRNTNQVNTSGYFAIQYGQNIQYFNLISRSQNFVQPSSGYTVDCTQHTLTFNVDYSGTPSLQFVPSYLEYTYTNGILKVKIPNNTTPYPRDWNMVVNGSGLSQIVPIAQEQRYEEWRRVDDQYVCVSGTPFALETLFTGVTPSSLSATDVTRQGSQVSISGACATTMYRWVDSGWRVTISSVSYIVEKEQYSENGGATWYDTGNTRIGNAVT